MDILKGIIVYCGVLLIVTACSTTSGVIPTALAEALPTTGQLASDEGVKLNAQGNHISYLDSLGYPTGGRGHLLTAAERTTYPEGTVIPDAIVSRWWVADNAKATAEVVELIKQHSLNVPREVEDILHNMMFNIGLDSMNGFRRMLKALQVNDYETVADEMLDSEWATIVGNRATRLATRMRNIK